MEKIICPSVEELSVITNSILCVKCGLTFNNEPCFRMHDFKVHKKQKMEKTREENARYHCPIETCTYSIKAGKSFTMMKYVKQHYLKVHAEKIYSCHQCSKSFSTEAAKKAHVRTCGINFTCSCNKVFNSYEALLTHSKRRSHTVDSLYKVLAGNRNTKSPTAKSSKCLPISKNNPPIYQVQTQTQVMPVYLVLNSVPKVTCNASVQTVELKNTCHKIVDVSNQRTQYTQTDFIPKRKRHKKCAETQTIKTEKNLVKNQQTKYRFEKSQISEDTINHKDLNHLTNNFGSENLFPPSPLPLQHDVGLQDFWVEKKTVCGTQTTSGKDFFEDLNDTMTQTELNKFCQRSNENYSCKETGSYSFIEINNSDTVNDYSLTTSSTGISGSDPLLTEETYNDKVSSSIETQTDVDYHKLFEDSDMLSRYFVSSSNNETQTTEDFDDFEPMHIYSNMCTQTCDEILSSNLTLSNTHTQTAWSHLEETPVSTETQTKFEENPHFSVDCKNWLKLVTQTNHMETQTDLLNIFDEIE